MALPDLMEAFGRELLNEEQARARKIATLNIQTRGDAGPFEGVLFKYDRLLSASDHSPLARWRASYESGIVSTFGRRGARRIHQLWLDNRASVTT